MAYKHIQVDPAGPVIRITFHRPDTLNSFNRVMSQEVQEALVAASSSAQCRAVMITGSGRAFCAGQDLSEVAPSSSGQVNDLGDIVASCYNPIVRTIRTMPKPVVAAVNGVAAGAGANLALACDFVVASFAASFIQSFSKVGLIPDSGGTFMLPRLIGVARAIQLTMLGSSVSAADAVTMGMIYRAVEPSLLTHEATALSERLASMPTKGLALTKQAINASFGHSIEEQLSLEEKLQREAGKTHDYAEGVRAFLEKRAPQYTGN